MRRQLAALEDALAASENRDRESQARIADLGSRLNVALAQKVQELARYRSDFFGRLRQILGNRPDIRIVGDRFVLQSEVLFPAGSATPEAGGRPGARPHRRRDPRPRQADPGRHPLGAAGRRPHRCAADRQRAIPLELVALGGPRHRGGAVPWRARASRPSASSPAAFGEFQPLEAGTTEEAYARNRRIEMKLTER